MNAQNNQDGVFLDPFNIIGNYEPEVGPNGYPGGGLGRDAYNGPVYSGWGPAVGPHRGTGGGSSRPRMAEAPGLLSIMA